MGGLERVVHQVYLEDDFHGDFCSSLKKKRVTLN